MAIPQEFRGRASSLGDAGCIPIASSCDEPRGIMYVGGSSSSSSSSSARGPATMHPPQFVKQSRHERRAAKHRKTVKVRQ